MSEEVGEGVPVRSGLPSREAALRKALVEAPRVEVAVDPMTGMATAPFSEWLFDAGYAAAEARIAKDVPLAELQNASHAELVRLVGAEISLRKRLEEALREINPEHPLVHEGK